MLKFILLPGAIPTIDVPVITSVVAAGTFGASGVPSVEGTAIETIGITLGGWEVDSPCLSFSVFFNVYSISFNISLSFMSRSIISSSDFCCITSAVCGCLEGGSFSCFLRAAMSSSFFLIRACMPLASLGSCPNPMMISYNDLIMLSLPDKRLSPNVIELLCCPRSFVIDGPALIYQLVWNRPFPQSVCEAQFGP